MKRGVRLLLLSAFLLIETSAAMRCAPDTSAHTIPADGRFVIEVSGNPNTYVPGERYTIYLRGNPDSQHKFKEFQLMVEEQHSERSLDVYSPAGNLQLLGDTLTKFSEKCRNAVVQTSSVSKSKVQVLWAAPKAGSGCVAIRATVLESRDVWYTDDGPLSKILCEEVAESEDTQPNVLKKCCACDEAKYEVTFEGLWTRNTHPKDFPHNGWLTRFSDIIGASHTIDYAFWKYGDLASAGLRQLAENGNTRQLESELKAKSEEIRTIIKARGISYPNVTGKTFAVFRVDKRHHLMSLVSMIDPSPDWIVGVSSLELCLRNCSWIESRVLNLYPWDAGTDDGPTYISSNQPSHPPEPIRRIKSNSPNDPRSPFYDPTGAEMKPLARLTLSRQRLYEKTCDPSTMIDGEEHEPGNNSGCEYTEWSEWSRCSATCGKGTKYKQRRVKSGPCPKPIVTRRKACEVLETSCRVTPHQEADPHCALTDWGEWSGCSVTCGMGVKTRSRRYMNRNAAKRCAAGREHPLPLEQTTECVQQECKNQDEEEMDSECKDKKWSEWSPCSSTCGKGVKERRKLAELQSDVNAAYLKAYGFLFEDDNCADVTETVECINDENPVCEDNPNEDSAFACGLPKDEGGCKSNVDRWYFDVIKGSCDIFSYSGCQGNKNNFKTLERCERVCNDYKKELIANRTAQKRQLGVTVSGVLAYNMQMQNDDAERENCDVPKGVPESDSQVRDRDGLIEVSGKIVDCQTSRWSAWSPCNVTCGKGYKTKYRVIKVQPANGGKRCPAKILKKKKCKVACSRENENENEDENESEHEEENPPQPMWYPMYTSGDNAPSDCLMSKWSAWSPCNKSCGPNAIRQRTRSILQYPSNGGKPCPTRTDFAECKMLACNE